ncbi:hypothetical protein [Lysinibacillus xylanilyticus]
MSHPYEQFEHTCLWAVINKGIVDFVKNTQREYFVGYLCKLVNELETEKE